MARADDMASFVVNIGISPTEYYSMTGYEREALIRAYEKKHK
tara:strand:+ start:6156 stop:6281 length:126 start_codon:yes stop_codon:yes gene_type:complete